MTTDTLQKALLVLTAAFPQLSFNAELYYKILGDLNDEDFMNAVMRFVSETKEVFPGTNIIAVLAEMTRDVGTARVRNLPRLRSPDEMKQIEDMEDTYRRLHLRADEEEKLRIKKREEDRKRAQEFLSKIQAMKDVAHE